MKQNENNALIDELEQVIRKYGYFHITKIELVQFGTGKDTNTVIIERKLKGVNR